MAMALEGKCYNCGSAQQNPASPTCYRCGTCQHTTEEEDEEDEEDGEGLTEAEQQIYDTIPDLYNTNWEIDGGGGADEGGVGGRIGDLAAPPRTPARCHQGPLPRVRLPSRRAAIVGPCVRGVRGPGCGEGMVREAGPLRAV